MFVGCLEAVTAVDGKEGGWIRSFTKVVRMEAVWNGLHDGWNRPEDFLAPFHHFSPALKFLRVFSTTLLSSYTFDLACSLPLLEDLTIVNSNYEADDDGIDDDGTVFRPSASPVFTGTLHLYQGLKHAAPRLLSLPNGLRFRKFVGESYLHGDLQWMAALVEGCSDTIEFVDLRWWVSSKSPSQLMRLVQRLI
jgi:hypothetical protein